MSCQKEKTNTCLDLLLKELFFFPIPVLRFRFSCFSFISSWNNSLASSDLDGVCFAFFPIGLTLPIFPESSALFLALTAFARR